MALIQCPECGGKLSDLAKICVHCGYPIAEINAKKAARLKAFKTIGEIVTFGTYSKEADGLDQTPIEWFVLEYNGANNQALLLSRYGLDAKPYHYEQNKQITWETCSLRSWLNNDFLCKAFTAEEQSAILTTTVDNGYEQLYSRFDPSCQWNPSGGNNTQDKVFLISCAEANNYLGITYRYLNADYNDSKDTISRLAPTEYARKQGAYSYLTPGGRRAIWWLRSPGTSQYSAAVVRIDGSLFPNNASHDNICVRPAIWIKCST